MLSSDQWLLIAGTATGLAVGLAPWFALRGVGMGRLAKAVALATELQNVREEQERLILQVRYYGTLRSEHFPSRQTLGLLFIFLWASVTASLVGLGIWTGLAPSAWLWIAILAAVSLWFNATWDKRFSPNTNHMRTHAILSKKEQAAWNRYLSLNGHAPTGTDEFDHRMRRRERYLRWVKPIEDRLDAYWRAHPWVHLAAKIAFALSLILVTVRAATGDWPGEWPWR